MELFAAVEHFSTRCQFEFQPRLRLRSQRQRQLLVLVWSVLVLVFVWTGSLQLLCPLLNINKNIMPPQWHSRCLLILILQPCRHSYSCSNLCHTHGHGHGHGLYSSALHFIPLAATPHAFLHSTQAIEHLFKQPPRRRRRRRRHHHRTADDDESTLQKPNKRPTTLPLHSPPFVRRLCQPVRSGVDLSKSE